MMIYLQNIKKYDRRKAFFKKDNLFLGLLFLVLVSTIIINLCSLEANSQGNYQHYTVKPGDTLWSIAQEHCSNETDPREYIDHVKAINSLENANIWTGQALELPEE